MIKVNKSTRYYYKSGEIVRANDYVSFRESNVYVLKNVNRFVELGIVEKKEKATPIVTKVHDYISNTLQKDSGAISIMIAEAYGINKNLGRTTLIHTLQACHKQECKIIERMSGEAYLIKIKDLGIAKLDCTEPVATELQQCRAVFYDEDVVKRVIEVVKAYEEEAQL